jgi:hypothetical protein
VYEHGGLTELTPKGSTADAAFGNGFKIAGCMELNKKASAPTERNLERGRKDL